MANNYNMVRPDGHLTSKEPSVLSLPRTATQTPVTREEANKAIRPANWMRPLSSSSIKVSSLNGSEKLSANQSNHARVRLTSEQ